MVLKETRLVQQAVYLSLLLIFLCAVMKPVSIIGQSFSPLFKKRVSELTMELTLYRSMKDVEEDNSIYNRLLTFNWQPASNHYEALGGNTANAYSKELVLKFEFDNEVNIPIEIGSVTINNMIYNITAQNRVVLKTRQHESEVENMIIDFVYNGDKYHTDVSVTWRKPEIGSGSNKGGFGLPAGETSYGNNSIVGNNNDAYIYPGHSVQLIASASPPLKKEFEKLDTFGSLYLISDQSNLVYRYKVRLGTFSSEDLAKQKKSDIIKHTKFEHAFVIKEPEKKIKATWGDDIPRWTSKGFIIVDSTYLHVSNPGTALAMENTPQMIQVYSTVPATVSAYSYGMNIERANPNLLTSADLLVGVPSSYNSSFNKYYIQLAALKKYPASNSFENINDFTLYLQKVFSLNKILAGPFNTREEALAGIPKLRALGYSSAFPIKLGEGDLITILKPRKTTIAAPIPYDSYRAPLFHIVKKGDTLFSIAKRYGLTVNRLKGLNGISANGVIKIDQRLVVE